MDRTEAQTDELAKRSLNAVLAATSAHDLAQLDAGSFSDLMRRGLERLIDQTPIQDARKPEDVDWTSYRRKDSKLFSDMQAYLYEVIAGGRQWLALTGFDDSGHVCEFAFKQDSSKLDLPYLDDKRGFHNNPWMGTALSATRLKIDALLPGNAGVGYSTPRLPETMTATVQLPFGYFETLSRPGANRLLDELSSIMINGARLSYGQVRPSALHIVIFEYDEKPNSTRAVIWVGVPPQELWLADRLVEVPN